MDDVRSRAARAVRGEETTSQVTGKKCRVHGLPTETLRHGLVVRQRLQTPWRVSEAPDRNVMHALHGSTTVRGREHLRLHPLRTERQQELDEPGRDHVTLVARKRGDDVQSSHGRCPIAVTGSRWKRSTSVGGSPAW